MSSSSSTTGAPASVPIGSFSQLIGAAGDVRELEYISALLQTTNHQNDDDKVRIDASICSEDIRLFLSSRYGIDISRTFVRRRILRGLITTKTTTTTTSEEEGGGGGNHGSNHNSENRREQGDDDEEDYLKSDNVIDLMELVALLLLPTFQKAANQILFHHQKSENNEEKSLNDNGAEEEEEGIVPAPKGMIQYVLQMILHDVTGNSQPKRLTPELVQKILIAYGENDLAQDEQLLQEMVNVANTATTSSTTSASNGTTILGNANKDTSVVVPDKKKDYSSTTTMDTAARETTTLADTATGTHIMVEASTSSTSNSEVPLSSTQVLKDSETDSITKDNDDDDENVLLLTKEVFAKALSYDIQLYDLKNETRMTTNMEDVFGPNGDTEAILLNDDDDDDDDDDNNNNNNKDNIISNNDNKDNNNNDPQPSPLQQVVMNITSQLQQEEVTYSNVSFKDEEEPTNNNNNRRHDYYYNQNNNKDQEALPQPLEKQVVPPEQQQQQQAQQPEKEILKRKRTFPSIDVTAGTYRSKSLVVVVWATFIITYFAYQYTFNRQFVDESECTGDNQQFVYSYSSPWKANEEAMACQMGYSILGWLDEFWAMCWNGVIYVGLGSIGNSIHCKRSWKPFVGAFFMAVLSVGYFIVAPKEHKERWILYIACLLLGVTAVLLHLGHALEILFSSQTLESYCPSLYKIIQGTVVSEKISKRAAAQKIAQLVSNALDIVATKDSPESVLRTHYGRALTNYARNGKKYVNAGGHMWAWQRMMKIGKTNFAKDGIWINSRILAGNIGQCVVAVYTLMGGVSLTKYVVNNFDEEWAKQQFRSFAERTFDTTMQDQDEVANALVSNVSTLVSGFLAQGSVADSLLNDSGGCSGIINNNTTGGMAVEDILETYCNNSLVDGGLNLSVVSSSATQQLHCDPSAPVNYLCPLLDANVSENLNVTSQQALLGGSGFDSVLLEQVVRDAVYQAADDSVESLYPAEKYMVMAPMIAGVTVAFLTCAYLALSYIPSVATTILKLRCGHIDTLRNPEFNRFRRAQDQVCMLTGSIFWGTLVSGLVVGGTVGLVIFFFLWQATAYFAQRLLAIVIGIVAVTLFRLALVSLCRFSLYKSFYRERPGLANLLFLALEWAVFALSVGFIFARMIKLMLAAGMSIGRIDTPFLAPGVGRIGPLNLDNYPMIHLKDVLSHEAHRHPYIEQLGVLYLMKLRHGSRFGQRAGTCWRLIFVHALLPWLHKYRVLTRTMQQQLTAIEDDYHGRKEETGKPLLDYPSLTFKSLRNFEPESAARDKYPMQAMVAPQALFGTSDIIVDEKKKGNTNDDDDEDSQAKRIQQLEEENRQLKEALAKAALMGSFQDC